MLLADARFAIPPECFKHEPMARATVDAVASTALRAAKAVENFRRDCDAVEHRSVEGGSGFRGRGSVCAAQWLCFAVQVALGWRYL